VTCECRPGAHGCVHAWRPSPRSRAGRARVRLGHLGERVVSALDALHAARAAWEKAGRPGAQAQLRLEVGEPREVDVHGSVDLRRAA
jgi:hypothetical protein